MAGVGDIAQLHEARGPAAANEADARTFFDMFDGGLDRLAQRPQPGEKLSEFDNLTEAYSGDVGAAKVEMFGGADMDGAQSEGAQQTSIEERLTSLYFELTHYQIAWKIAQNVQRDISQVLRGS